jgi:hypothetical protein
MSASFVEYCKEGARQFLQTALVSMYCADMGGDADC